MFLLHRFRSLLLYGATLSLLPIGVCILLQPGLLSFPVSTDLSIGAPTAAVVLAYLAYRGQRDLSLLPLSAKIGRLYGEDRQVLQLRDEIPAFAVQELWTPVTALLGNVQLPRCADWGEGLATRLVALVGAPLDRSRSVHDSSAPG